MAKISTYQTDNNVTISDRLIGSDNENANQTKNFTVGDIIDLAESIIVGNLSLSFIPYTGATQGVDLGSNGLAADSATFTSSLNCDGEIVFGGDAGTLGYILVSQGGGTPPIWQDPSSAVTMPYISAHSEVSQVALLPNTEYAMQFEVTDLVSGINIDLNGVGDSTRITPATSGLYNIDFAAQFNRTTGGPHATVDVWLKYNGIDVSYSHKSFTVKDNEGNMIASWNFIAQCSIDDAAPYFEIMWATSNVDVTINTPTGIVEPIIPSIKLTVNKVSN